MRILPSMYKRTERLRFGSDAGLLIGSGVGRSDLTPEGVTRGLALWELETSDEPTCLLPNVNVNDFVLVEGTDHLLVDAKGVGISLVNLKTHRVQAMLKSTDVPHLRVISPCGRRFVQQDYIGRYTRRTKIELRSRWIQPDGKTIDHWQQNLIEGWATWQMVFSPDGTLLLLVDAQLADRILTVRLQIRSAETGELIRIEPLNNLAVNDLILSPDREYFAIRAGHQLLVGRLDDCSHAVTITNDNPSHFSDVAFHPASHLLAAASNDQSIKLFDCTSWSPRGSLSWMQGKMRSIAFSPCGTIAAAGSSFRQVIVWDVD